MPNNQRPPRKESPERSLYYAFGSSSAPAHSSTISNWKKYLARVSQMHSSRNMPTSAMNSGAPAVLLRLIACAQASIAITICAMNSAVHR